ncbi:MAG: protease inhibitor I42 family protein [Verrucomicrobiae bacterium]|nr:protease inhibitor I42 family protein [Verrucomicrobiae bacterium]
MKLSLATRAVAVMVAVWLAGCAATGSRFTGESQSIDAIPGQRFEIALESNPTTGYSWTLAERLDDRAIAFVGKTYHPGGSAAMGAGGVEVWTFVARREGTARIVLAYRRPWEKGQAPAMTRVFRVAARAR